MTKSNSAETARSRLADIPVRAADGMPEGRAGLEHGEQPDCAGGELFALQVLGDDMLPEFSDGDIIIVEPEGVMGDGSFVVARYREEWVFRQLCGARGRWTLRTLNPAGSGDPVPITSLDCIRGVVIQKSRPGRRRETKRYVD